jgi:hypothetical protein
MPVSPTLFLALAGLICAGCFLVGLRFVRYGSPVGTMPVEQVRVFGRVMMIAAPAMFVVMCIIVMSGAAGPMRTVGA